MTTKTTSTRASRTGKQKEVVPVDSEESPIVASGFIYKRGSRRPRIWSRRYFVFGTDEPTPLENLRLYHKKYEKHATAVADTESAITASATDATLPAEGESTPKNPKELPKNKYEEANKNLHTKIAHATQTGKGLLYYYKSENKVHTGEPLGIINLRDVETVDILHDIGRDHAFYVKSKHRNFHFAAESETMRKSWVKTIQTKSSEAKKTPTIEHTDAYKDVYYKLVNRRAFVTQKTVTPFTTAEEATDNWQKSQTPADQKRKLSFKSLSFLNRKTEKSEGPTEAHEKTEKTDGIKIVETTVV